MSCIAKGVDAFSANQFDGSMQEVAIPGSFSEDENAIRTAILKLL